MGYTFERPVGAAADAKELEYIAALHQTQHGEQKDWRDASIEADDVKNFLLSRYGIEVTKKEVLDSIFAEMGGSDDSDECIDLTEGERVRYTRVLQFVVTCSVVELYIMLYIMQALCF